MREFKSIDAKTPENNSFKDIKPTTDITINEAKSFLNNLLDSLQHKFENTEKALDGAVKNYWNELKSLVAFPDTLPKKAFDSSSLEKKTTDEIKPMKEEFLKSKDSLIKEWEQIHGKEWPTYDKDIVSVNGKIIRRAGDKYDAHHIQSLEMGGKNDANNITPMHAENHYDRQGIHSSNGSYSALKNLL